MKGRVNWGETTLVATFDRPDDTTVLGMLVGIAEFLRTEAGADAELLSIVNHGEEWQVVWTEPRDGAS